MTTTAAKLGRGNASLPDKLLLHPLTQTVQLRCDRHHTTRTAPTASGCAERVAPLFLWEMAWRQARGLGAAKRRRGASPVRWPQNGTQTSAKGEEA
jgi:hypothetical protein